MQSKLDQCISGNQEAVIASKELDSCHEELSDLQKENRRSRWQQIAILRVATADSGIDLWHGDFENGEYVIAYELDSSLTRKLKFMIPKVRVRFRVMKLVQSSFEYIIQIKAMKKIEEVTCIKFEDRAQENYH